MVPVRARSMMVMLLVAFIPGFPMLVVMIMVVWRHAAILPRAGSTGNARYRCYIVMTYR
jgi:hypothetical protein